MKRFIKKLLRESLLNEMAEGKHLVVVDIQPEYQNAFGYMAEELAEYINENIDKISNLTFLYNGESLGMISESDYRYWWLEQGLEEDIVFNAHMYDKGYAFFRYCMDSGIGEDDIANFVKFMLTNDIHDSRDMTEEFWVEYVKEYGDNDLKDLMEFSDDAIHIPDLMEELSNYENIILTGGGVNECLKEVEIALKAMDKPYQIWDEFTY